MEALVRRLTVGILANSATRSPTVTSEWSHRSEQWFPASKVVIGAHPAMARESWNGGVGTQVDGRNSCEFRYEELRPRRASGATAASNGSRHPRSYSVRIPRRPGRAGMEALVRRLTVGILANSATKSFHRHSPPTQACELTLATHAFRRLLSPSLDARWSYATC
jgi:hypothetical protein